MQTNTFLKQQTQNPIREVFARQFFDVKHYPKSPKPANYRPFLDIQPDFFLAVIRSVHDNKAVLQHVRGRIRSFCPDIIYLHQNSYLYLLFYGVHTTESHAVLSQLSGILTDYGLQIGFSETFTDTDKRALYIQQAEIALKTGARINSEKNIYYYPDYYLSAVLLEAADRLFPENLIPPELFRLQNFDRQNQTDYSESLKLYLYERNNLNKAAAQLHLHRNSLRYRLDKISSFLHISPDDPATAQRLQIGFLLLELIQTLIPIKELP